MLSLRKQATSALRWPPSAPQRTMAHRSSATLCFPSKLQGVAPEVGVWQRPGEPRDSWPQHRQQVGERPGHGDRVRRGQPAPTAPTTPPPFSRWSALLWPSAAPECCHPRHTAPSNLERIQRSRGGTSVQLDDRTCVRGVRAPKEHSKPRDGGRRGSLGVFGERCARASGARGTYAVGSAPLWAFLDPAVWRLAVCC